jgi:hypothetical protein
MIVGWFDRASRRPFVIATVYLPRIGTTGTMPFIVDTGSDRTVLMPDDAWRLGLTEDLKTGIVHSLGIGGAVRAFEEPTVLQFNDPDLGTYLYELRAQVMPDTLELEDVPSLLGRDVLNRWRMTWDPPAEALTFAPFSADELLPREELP